MSETNTFVLTSIPHGAAPLVLPAVINNKRVRHKDRRSGNAAKGRKNTQTASFAKGSEMLFAESGNNLFFAGSDMPDKSPSDIRQPIVNY